MPLCMHWVLERKSRRGTWEAVLSNTSTFRNQASPAPEGYAPALSIGSPDPAFFAVMSGQPCMWRGTIDPKLEPFATPGLPKDVSSYARDAMTKPTAVSETAARPPLKDIGWVKLTRLERVAARALRPIGVDEALSGNAPAEDYLAQLLARLHTAIGTRNKKGGPPLEGQVNLADIEVLHGAIFDDGVNLPRHPDMAERSQHTRLAMKQRLDALLPCRPENLRLITGYGM